MESVEKESTETINELRNRSAYFKQMEKTQKKMETYYDSRLFNKKSLVSYLQPKTKQTIEAQKNHIPNLK